MRKKILKIGKILALSLLCLAQGGVILAQGQGNLPEVPPNIWNVVQSVVRAIVVVVFILGVIFLAAGGVIYVTSGGDPGKVETGKNLMIYAAIGMGIAGLAWAFMNVIAQAIFNWQPQTGGTP